MCIMVFGLTCCDDSEDESRNTSGLGNLRLTKMSYLCSLDNTWTGIGGWIGYDDKGRLSNITQERFVTAQTTKKDTIVFIDYDRNTVHFHPFRNRAYSFHFRLNEQGYITLLDNYVFRYDESGILYDIRQRMDMWTFNYENEELTGFVKSLRNGTPQLYYYCDYDKDPYTGELLLYLNGTWLSNTCSEESFYRHISFIAAYQAGLFGRVTGTVRSFASQENGRATLERTGDRDHPRDPLQLPMGDSIRVYCTFEEIPR